MRSEYSGLMKDHELWELTERALLIEILKVLRRIEKELRPRIIMTPGKPAVSVGSIKE